VDKDVSKASEPFESLAEAGVDDPNLAEPGEDIFVVLRAHTEVGAQDMVADVEDRLRGQLEAPLDGPRVAKTGGGPDGVGAVQFLQPRDDFFQVQQPLSDRLGPKHHGDVPPRAGRPGATVRRGTA